jgi:hypothetical protein
MILKLHVPSLSGSGYNTKPKNAESKHHTQELWVWMPDLRVVGHDNGPRNLGQTSDPRATGLDTVLKILVLGEAARLNWFRSERGCQTQVNNNNNNNNWFYFSNQIYDFFILIIFISNLIILMNLIILNLYDSSFYSF